MVRAQELGLLADAKAAYQEAIRLRPDFAIAHGNLASCFYDEGDMKTAIRCVSCTPPPTHTHPGDGHTPWGPTAVGRGL